MVVGKRYDPDEKFSLHPLDPEEGLARLLGADDEDESGEDEDS